MSSLPAQSEQRRPSFFNNNRDIPLDHPEVPLHTNGSENDIRAVVTKRKISGGTLSDAGRQARDAPLGLMKTCRKLGVSFFEYLGCRLGVQGGQPFPPLEDLLRADAS